MNNKYYLECLACGEIIPGFDIWFTYRQLCPKCGSKHAEVRYQTDYKKLLPLFESKPDSFWHYLDYLPLNNAAHIVSCKEGAIPLENWCFLEDFARTHYGINCKVWVYRNDQNGGTGTFKDVAASLAASLFRAHNINHYIVASTGNTATAYSKYLALADVACSVFIPDNALEASEAVISAYCQKVFRIKGDYAKAKSVAAEFAHTHQILISSGNIDPIRVEAKKTMVFEWLRQIKMIPDVYIQAISGGTGPIAVDKGIREMSTTFPQYKTPRFIMVQPDKCAPMVRAWLKAEKADFPEGFENDYPIIEAPPTSVPTLATGNPATYPIIARLVKKTAGTFIAVDENKLADFARLAAFERKVLLGPASAVCLAGFFEALKKNQIKNDETILINVGEGVERAPQFLNDMIYTTSHVETATECCIHNKQNFKKSLWEAILK